MTEDLRDGSIIPGSDMSCTSETWNHLASNKMKMRADMMKLKFATSFDILPPG